MSCLNLHNVLVHGYGISSKSHQSEILFQGPIQCNGKFIRKQLDFMGGIYRDRHTCSFNNEPFVCLCIPFIDRLPCGNFKGDVYWDELAELYIYICSNVSRVVGFQGVVRF